MVLSNLEIPLDLSMSCLNEIHEFEENLEYMIIFHRNGLPIFSKNFSKDSNMSIEKNNLLAGFLSAITTFPLAIGYNNKDLKSLYIAKSKLSFRYTKNDIVIVIAIKNDERMNNADFCFIDLLLNDMQLFVENEFKDENWELVKIEIRKKFNDQLNKTFKIYSYL